MILLQHCLDCSNFSNASYNGLPSPRDIGLVVAAIVAGLFALLTAITSRNNTITQARINWIDKQKDNVASLISAFHNANYWRFKTDSAEEEENKDVMNESSVKYMEYFQSFIEKSSLMDLSMNYNNKREKGLSSALEVRRRISSLLTDQKETYTIDKVGDFIDLVDDFEENMKTYFKHEWKRTKKGDLSFNFYKWAIILLSFGVSASYIFYCFIYYSP